MKETELHNCPTCGAQCTIGGDNKEGTHYYVPVPSLSERAVEERAIAFAEWIDNEQWIRTDKYYWNKYDGADPLQHIPAKTSDELFALFQQQQSK